MLICIWYCAKQWREWSGHALRCHAGSRGGTQAGEEASVRDRDQESAREHLIITEGLGKLGADGRQGRKKGCTSEENAQRSTKKTENVAHLGICN